MSAGIRGADCVSSSTSVGSVALAWPSGIVSGDQALLCFAITDATAPTMAGWTLIRTHQYSTSFRLYLLTKTCDGSETGTLTATFPTLQRGSAGVAVFSGVNAVVASDTAGVSTVDPPALTSLTGTRAAVTFIGERGSSALSTAYTAPSGFTLGDGSYATGAGATTLGVAHLLTDDTDGTVDPPTWARNGTATGVASLTIALPVASTNSTWTGSTGAVSAAATSGSFSPGAVTWSGTTAAVTVAADAGSFMSSASWSGSAGSVAAAADSGAFAPGAASWAATTGAVAVTGASGAFTPGTVAWPGSTGSVTAAATTEAFTPGAATWSGSTGALVAAGDSGSFTGAGMWVGSTAAITAAATGGAWSAGPVTWTGGAGTVQAVAATGAFTPGAASWVASAGALVALTDGGGWVPGPATWAASVGAITVASSPGAWTPGPASWGGAGGAVLADASAGAWTPGDAAWLASLGVVLIDVVPGRWGSPPPSVSAPPERTLLIDAESHAWLIPAESHTLTC